MKQINSKSRPFSSSTFCFISFKWDMFQHFPLRSEIKISQTSSSSLRSEKHFSKLKHSKVKKSEQLTWHALPPKNILRVSKYVEYFYYKSCLWVRPSFFKLCRILNLSFSTRRSATLPLSLMKHSSSSSWSIFQALDILLWMYPCA